MRFQKYSTTTVLLLMGLLLCFNTACDRLHEDLQPCQQGLRLRFVYDYNMEFANAFTSQVDCLTVLVYDEAGHWVATQTAGKENTSNEDWRMIFDLPEGNYQVLAYGGLGCDEASFEFISNPEASTIDEVEVRLKEINGSRSAGHPLHPLFYGRLNINVPLPEANSSYTEGIVYMMKDTNDIRIVLANETGLPTLGSDFEFTITDNNSLLNWENNPISETPDVYTPWAQGTSEIGLITTDKPARVAYAEFSTSRLMDKSGATLTVKRVSDGGEVLSIPLNNFLLLLKSQKWEKMPAQEFLDRQSNWNLTFFLTDNGTWVKAFIVINDWIVRINDITDSNIM